MRGRRIAEILLEASPTAAMLRTKLASFMPSSDPACAAWRRSGPSHYAALGCFSYPEHFISAS